VRSAPLSVELVDCQVAGLIRMCRSLLGYGYSPVRIELMRARPQDICTFERVLRTPCEFNAPGNRIVFDRQTMERPLEGGNPELARHSDAIALRYLARMERENVQARVRSVLVRRLPHGEPSLQEIAQSINVHERTLQRKLRESGTTYKELLDATRHELALAYLSSAVHSVSDVTYKLGFAASGSFTRAFRRWTGVAPSAWRARASASGSSCK
jgi:AraC-like DNA-binding protein